MKVNKKVLSIVISVFLMLFLIFATMNDVQAWDATSAVDNFETNYSVADHGAESSAKQIMGALVTVIRVAGTGIALIMIIYIGIKYMTAAPDEKAEFKKSAVAYVVGAIVLFASTQIVSILIAFAGNIQSS